MFRCIEYSQNRTIIPMDPEFKHVECEVDLQNNKYPYCLVWTALPCITCCCPCIGHVGICKSDGTIFDFVGAGPIHSEQLAFGDPLKYLVLDHADISDEQWNNSIDQANQQFSRTNHNLFCHNCHHHVVRVLNLMSYKGRSNWSQVDLALMATFKAKHINCKSITIYLLPLLLLLWLLLR